MFIDTSANPNLISAYNMQYASFSGATPQRVQS